MFDKKLEKLTSFIEEIDALSPIDFFLKAQHTVPHFFDKGIDNRNDVVFQKEFSMFIQNAQKKKFGDDILIYYLFQNLYMLLRKKMIYVYAKQLGIEQSLFKNEMNKLFKGKFK